jgi:glycosyltransferase involved in cell wall biosynthesis
MKRIIIITGQHLVSNPRVWKEANALNKAGFKVTIFSTWYSSEKLQQDIQLIHPNIDYKSSFNIIPSLYKLPIILYAKSIKRVANILYRFLKLSSIYQEVYLPNRQLKVIQSQRCDLFICHQESGLLLGNTLLRKGHKVAFDFEDFYSEDYLNQYRPVGLLKKSESFALNNAVYVTCPSESMAKFFQMSCPIEKHVYVIYNCFPIVSDSETEIQKIPNSLLWFSQTIGPGRGIEELVQAMKLIQSPLEIHFVGNVSEGYKQFILNEFSKTTHKIQFIPLLSHAVLINYISRFDIGLALELSNPISRSLTISNKILLYLQMNLKVIASKTKGQLELHEYFPDQIKYVDLNDITNFVEIIREMILLDTNKNKFRFDHKYSWDTSAKKLLQLVESSVLN